MVAVLVGLFFGLVNAARGEDWLPRVLAAAMMALVNGSALAALEDYHLLGWEWLWQSLVVFALIWLGLLPSWSLAAIHGRDRDFEHKFYGLAGALFGWVRDNHLFGTLGMSLRWLLCFAPLFAFAVWVTGTSQWGVSLLLLVGPLYWLCGRVFRRESHAMHAAEAGAGVLLGVGLWV